MNNCAIKKVISLILFFIVSVKLTDTPNPGCFASLPENTICHDPVALRCSFPNQAFSSTLLTGLLNCNKFKTFLNSPNISKFCKGLKILLNKAKLVNTPTNGNLTTDFTDSLYLCSQDILSGEKENLYETPEYILRLITAIMFQEDCTMEEELKKIFSASAIYFNDMDESISFFSIPIIFKNSANSVYSIVNSFFSNFLVQNIKSLKDQGQMAYIESENAVIEYPEILILYASLEFPFYTFEDKIIVKSGDVYELVLIGNWVNNESRRNLYLKNNETWWQMGNMEYKKIDMNRTMRDGNLGIYQRLNNKK